MLHTECMNPGNTRQRATLVLVPTDLELTKLALHSELQPFARVAICGFGAVEAAARTATLLAEHRPQRALLIGIAGTYNRSQLDLGSATCFEQAAIDGIGAGAGHHYLAAAAMGFSEQPSFAALHVPPKAPRAELLLTCCAASATAGEMDERKKRFPKAVAEDMEGFAVARACQLANVPLSIVRGISNFAGDRDRSTWQIDKALAAAAGLAHSILESDEAWEQMR